VEDANDDQKKHVAGKVQAELGDLKGKKIGVWGLAFKPGTDDVREAPAAVIIDTFLKGGAQVVAHDPQAEETFSRDFKDHPQLSYAKSAYAALEGCDALVLITEWKEYRRPNWQRVTDLMRGNHVFDLRNQYQAEAFAGLNISYHSVGRPSL
jgi:UDPglucose 6-dehydrogenase